MFNRRPSHRQELMQMMAQLQQGDSQDLQNAALMQRLQQDQMLMPYQQERAQNEAMQSGLQTQQMQMGLENYPEMQDAELEAAKAKALSQYGQFGYYTDMMQNPAIQSQIMERAGMQGGQVVDPAQEQMKQQLMQQLQQRGR